MRHVGRGWLRAAIVAAGAVPMLGLLLAVPVQAVDTLTVSTPYPTVQVDPGGTVKLPLLVQTPTPQQVDLSVNGAPQGWTASFHGGGFIVSSVFANGNAASPAPADLVFEVVVPVGAQPNSYKMTVHASANGLSADLPVTLVVAGAGGGSVSMSTDFPSQKAAPGAAVSFNVTLRNDTATELEFSLAVPDAPDGWTVTAQPSGSAQATTFKVAAGDTSSISVAATSQSTTASGDYAFHVAATAGTTYSAVQALAVTIAGTGSLSTTSTLGVLNTNATAGTPTNFSIDVTNTGSATLSNITLSATPPTGWKVTYTPATIASLDPQALQSVTAAIQPDSNAVAGDYVVTLRVASGSASSTLDVRTTVQTSTLWGYVGIGLIVLVVVGLLLVFRRYGRR